MNINSIQFNTDLLPMSTDSKDNQCKDTTVLQNSQYHHNILFEHKIEKLNI